MVGLGLLLRQFAPQLIGVAALIALCFGAYGWYHHKLTKQWDAGYNQATKEYEEVVLKAKQLELDAAAKRLALQDKVLKDYETANSKEKAIQAIIQSALGKSVASNKSYLECVAADADIGLLNKARDATTAEQDTGLTSRFDPALPKPSTVAR
jgi:hypothetical protein